MDILETRANEISNILACSFTEANQIARDENYLRDLRARKVAYPSWFDEWISSMKARGFNPDI